MFLKVNSRRESPKGVGMEEVEFNLPRGPSALLRQFAL